MKKHNANAIEPTPEELLEALERAPIGVARVDPEGVITWCNADFARLLGYGSHQIVGNTFSMFTVHSDIDADINEFVDLMGGHQPADQYFLKPKGYLKRDGSVLKANLKAIGKRRDDGSVYVAFGFVTPLSGVAEALEDLITKMESEGRLVSPGEKIDHDSLIETVKKWWALISLIVCAAFAGIMFAAYKLIELGQGLSD